jgi:hypothetical protein
VVRDYRAIDVWVNPFTPERMKKQWVEVMATYREMETAKIMKMPEERLKGYTPAEYVARMDELGIEKSFIPAWKMGSYFHSLSPLIWDISPEEIKREIIDQYPDRFHGLYGLNPWKGMEGVRELERAVKDYGFIGAHMHPYPYGPFNDKIWYPFYAKCVELDIPVISQIGHSGELMPSAPGRPILIDEVALYFPELRIIAAHTGWPWVEELIAMAWKHPNVYIATTAHLPRYWEPSLVHFINTRGQDKVIWGSDWPITDPKDSLAQVEQLGLREEAKRKLLRENAIKVYKLRT